MSPRGGQSFKTHTSIWAHTGNLELLYDDNEKYVGRFQAADTEIKWDVDDDCPHDIALMGLKLGFVKEAEGAAKRAKLFLATRHCTNKGPW